MSKNLINNLTTEFFTELLKPFLPEEKIINTPKLVFEEIQGDSIVCDNCGWTWKIKDGGDDLYICHKCNHDNTPKQQEPEHKEDFFQPLEDKEIDFTTLDKDKVVTSKKKLENDPKFTKLLGSLTLHMMNNGLKIDPLPNVEFIDNDNKNASDILGKTAYYDPNNHSIVLYTCNRHPKDILRSYAHEMIHHMQNLENRINNIQGQNINEDDYLAELEREAYEKGNMLFRGWENNLKND